MPLIPFPNVPLFPGVPDIIRSAVATVERLLDPSLVEVGEVVSSGASWGVYDQDGRAALEPDTFLDIDYRNDVKVSNYPQEAGAFASYNKVATPYDCRVRMAIGRDEASRAAFLEQCDIMLQGIDLFTVVTPETTYTNAALEAYDYRRESKNGVSMIVVDLKFTEVRTPALATFSPPTPSAPTGDAPAIDPQVNTANPVSSGQVQALAPTLAQAASPDGVTSWQR